MESQYWNRKDTMKGTLEFYSETGTEGGHWAFSENGKQGYDALHILETGDYLKISNNGILVWEGEIDLEPLGLFKESAKGMWIHADQKGIDRETWAEFFFDELPAELSELPRP